MSKSKCQNFQKGRPFQKSILVSKYLRKYLLTTLYKGQTFAYFGLQRMRHLFWILTLGFDWTFDI